MPQRYLTRCLLGLMAASWVGAISTAAEIRVDCKAAAGGSGSAGAPCATLAEAVAAAAPGDVIVLAPGEYVFSPPKKPFEGRMVTVRTAAAGKTTVSRIGGNCSFLRFEGLVIPEAVRVNKGRWVQFVRCTFTPTSKQNFWGVLFQECDHCGLYGCVVKTLSTSQVSMGNVRHAEYRFNEVANGDSDAFQGGGDGILIEGNWVHDMHPTPKAHPDGIQLANMRNLTVRGNVFDCPNMQTFFFGWTAKETTYENIVLENNVCTTALYHGLSTHPSGDLVVRNNLFICDAKLTSGSEAIDLKNMQGKCTVVNNLFWQLSIARRDQDLISHNIYMQKHWHDGLPGDAAVLSRPEACFVRPGRSRLPAEGRCRPSAPPLPRPCPKRISWAAGGPATNRASARSNRRKKMPRS